ncbi:MAG: hypothetical protein PUB96_06365 [Helicobacteraceae bacterium]|nr:hypothetical protein [Helicobacteraceae bacterium]
MESTIFLAQSDTTAGFLSKNHRRLNEIKGRNLGQSVLITLDSLSKLKNLVRVPECHKNRVRRSKKSSFVYKKSVALKAESLAIRVVFRDFRAVSHADFLRFFPYLYSSSANLHKSAFSLEYALKNTDYIVLDNRGLSQNRASKIYKLSNKSIKKLR